LAPPLVEALPACCRRPKTERKIIGKAMVRSIIAPTYTPGRRKRQRKGKSLPVRDHKQEGLHAGTNQHGEACAPPVGAPKAHDSSEFHLATLFGAQRRIRPKATARMLHELA